MSILENRSDFYCNTNQLTYTQLFIHQIIHILTQTFPYCIYCLVTMGSKKIRFHLTANACINRIQILIQSITKVQADYSSVTNERLSSQVEIITQEIDEADPQPEEPEEVQPESLHENDRSSPVQEVHQRVAEERKISSNKKMKKMSSELQKIERNASTKMFLLSLLPELNEMSDLQIKVFKRKIFTLMDDITDEFP